MSRKINVAPLIGAHFDTLRNNRTGKLSKWDLSLHLLLPTVIALVSWLVLEVNLDNKYGNVIAALAIVFGFAFAAAIFIFQLRMQMAEMQVSSAKSQIAEIAPQIDTSAPKLVDQLFSNCMYAVILSGASTLLAGSVDVLGLGRIGDAALIWFTVHLVIVLLMCFKRIGSAYGKISRISK